MKILITDEIEQEINKFLDYMIDNDWATKRGNVFYSKNCVDEFEITFSSDFSELRGAIKRFECKGVPPIKICQAMKVSKCLFAYGPDRNYTLKKAQKNSYRMMLALNECDYLGMDYEKMLKNEEN